MFKKFIISISCLFLSVTPYGCNEEDIEKHYLSKFRKQEVELKAFSLYLIEKFRPQDGSIKEEIIFINPKFVRKSIPLQQIDSTLLNFMDNLGIAEIDLRLEDTNCGKGQNFDKIFFEPARDSYYPVVQYIFSVCRLNYVSYKSETIIRTSLDSNWHLLIDSNFP
ncbi:MAG: hypothetical protein EOO43_22650 [Flavobacterium sp.]|nr:MAG: hypothetical protein EOO43_22650 [Flavobacterium sp.]